jgi:hypothetical protein
MSTKHFCDGCGIEMDGKTLRTKLERIMHQSRHGLSFQIITGKDGGWHVGHWCTFCVIDRIRQVYDDREETAS